MADPREQQQQHERSSRPSAYRMASSTLTSTSRQGKLQPRLGLARAATHGGPPPSAPVRCPRSRRCHDVEFQRSLWIAACSVTNIWRSATSSSSSPSRSQARMLTRARGECVGLGTFRTTLRFCSVIQPARPGPSRRRDAVDGVLHVSAHDAIEAIQRRAAGATGRVARARSRSAWGALRWAASVVNHSTANQDYFGQHVNVSGPRGGDGGADGPVL